MVRSGTKVSQETFEDVVKENMEDFELPLEEAVQDALKQFEAQGMDTSELNTQMSLETIKVPFKQRIDAWVECIRDIEQQVELSSTSKLLAKMDELHAVLNQEEEHARNVLGQNGGVNIMLKVLQMGTNSCNKDAEALVRLAPEEVQHVVEKGLRIMNQLCHNHAQNREFVRLEGVKILNELLKSHMDHAELCPLILFSIKTVCSRFEPNKKAFSSVEGLDSLMKCFQTAHRNENLSKVLSGVLRVLTVNDDKNATFSQVHDVVRMLGEKGVFHLIRSEVETYQAIPDVLASWFVTLKQLAITEDNCSQIVELQILEHVLEAATAFFNDAAVVKYSLGVMRNIAAVDKFKSHLVTVGGFARVLQAMDVHLSDSSIQELACSTIAAIALRQPHLCADIVEAGAMGRIARSLKKHPNAVALIRAASLAIRNVVARSPELRSLVLEEDIEAPLREAQRLRGCGDESYAALRDLGCPVRLYDHYGGHANFNPVYLESQELMHNMKESAHAPFEQPEDDE